MGATGEFSSPAKQCCVVGGRHASQNVSCVIEFDLEVAGADKVWIPSELAINKIS